MQSFLKGEGMIIKLVFWDLFICEFPNPRTKKLPIVSSTDGLMQLTNCHYFCVNLNLQSELCLQWKKGLYIYILRNTMGCRQKEKYIEALGL